MKNTTLTTELSIPKFTSGYFILGLKFILLLILFFLGTNILLVAVRELAQETLLSKVILYQSYQPFLAFFIGIILTAILHSCNLLGAIAIILVSAKILDTSSAIAALIGINIGTTINPMLVSFGHIMRKKNFRKALSASMLHILLNFLPSILLLPFIYQAEYLFKAYFFPSRFSSWWSFNLWGEQYIENFLQNIGLLSYPLLLLFSAIAILFGVLVLAKLFFKEKIASIINQRIRKESKENIAIAIIASFILYSKSFIIKYLINSISNNKASLKQLLPWLLGANIGTAFTLLLASWGHSEQAIHIAFLYFSFSFFPAFLFISAYLQNKFIWLARYLGGMMHRYHLASFLYVLIFFFILPLLLIYLF
ncbi:MAG: hypothetical protein SFU27_12945 [Thermonemataceae bacterium]|nr:hypothetical protein [Thermonemataceae bacterium]